MGTHFAKYIGMGLVAVKLLPQVEGAAIEALFFPLFSLVSELSFTNRELPVLEISMPGSWGSGNGPIWWS